MAALTAGGAQLHTRLVQPIIFCGPGSNLYPLCSNTVASDVKNDATQSAQIDLPKAMLPVFNRPMIAFALQQLLSAGIRHAIVFAPSEHHSTIAAALKSLILIPPTLIQSGKKNFSSAAAAAAAAAVDEASKYPNVSVSVGLNSTSAASSAPAAGNPYLSGNDFAVSATQNETMMRVDLLPLGPEDVTTSKSDSRVSSAASKYKKLGTAGLISWLHSIGRLDKDPLILPVDLITQSVSLVNLIHGHVSGVPQPPALTCLMYERGAGEGTGKEREKDGPPKLFSAYDRTSSQSSNSTLGGSDHCTTHQLLLLQDSDDVSDLDSSDLHLRMSLLWSHPHVRISTSLLDSHVYLFNLQQLLSLLRSDAGQKMKSLREEVVPFMVKCSWMTGLREKAGWTTQTSNKNPATADHLSSWNTLSTKENTTSTLRSSTFVESDLLQAGSFFRPALDEIENRASPLYTPDRSHVASPSGKLDDQKGTANLQRQARDSAKKSASEARVNAVIFRLSPSLTHPIDPSSTVEEIREREEAAKREPFIARANTVPTYLECNRYLLRCLASGPSGQASSSAPGYAASLPPSALSHPLPLQSLPHPATATGSAASSQAADSASAQAGQDVIDPKAQISSDSLVENFMRVGERTTIKRSIVGRGCLIGKNVKLTGAILMDGVRIGDNAKLENCILSAGSVVDEKCNLKDCDVAASVRVPAGTNSKGEKFDE